MGTMQLNFESNEGLSMPHYVTEGFVTTFSMWAFVGPPPAIQKEYRKKGQHWVIEMDAKDCSQLWAPEAPVAAL